MEEHAVARNLQQSREEIRELLMPGASTGHVLPGHFPRSAVMRFLMDSGKRSVAIAALGTVATLIGHRRRNGAHGPHPAGAKSRWPLIGNALLPLLGAVRRR